MKDKKDKSKRLMLAISLSSLLARNGKDAHSSERSAIIPLIDWYLNRLSFIKLPDRVKIIGSYLHHIGCISGKSPNSFGFKLLYY